MNKIISVLALSASMNVYAAQELADSKQMGLDNQPRKSVNAQSGKPEEKISNLGDGVYLREYKDFGQPIVEVHPESGPSYYYNENEIREPAAADGVYDRQTPMWMVKQW